jgi:two-component system NtrC family sensor kinase
MIRSEDGLDEATSEKLELIQTQIARITRVTKDMMDFARARPAARTSVDVNRIVRASLRLAGFDKQFQQLALSTELDEDLPPVHGDGDQLQQVFLNLLLNARDAMPEGGRLTVSTYKTSDGTAVSISDSGPGIPENKVKKIFDPFFTTKTTGRGTGLGLAVCYGIVTAHGGKIEVESSENGSTFSAHFPPMESHTDDPPNLDMELK